MIPDSTASLTMYSIAGVSTIVSISFGVAFVAGKNLVPSPATGITAFVIFFILNLLFIYTPTVNS